MVEVAVLVSGERRDFDPEHFQKKFLDKLPDADVFFCMDDNSNINNVKNRYFVNDSFEPTSTNMHVQFQRNSHCYDFAKSKGNYEFVFKTRPDFSYSEDPFPTVDAWPNNAVQVRSRIVEEKNTRACERSIWPADVRSYEMVDDQMFITPIAFADKVFSLNTVGGPSNCTSDEQTRGWCECQFQRTLDGGNVPTQRTCFNAVISKHKEFSD